MFEWLWPPVCVGCARTGQRWCASCEPGSWLRPRSRSEGVEVVFALTRYSSPAGQALRRAKVDGDRMTIAALCATFAARLPLAFPPGSIDAVVPAPSTRRSRWNRGFSVGAMLARHASRTLGVPVRPVLRSTATGRLATLDAAQRRQALRGRLRANALVKGRVLLVDDVLTSGATAEAAATELLGGSTEQVVLATLAAVDDLC